MNERIPILMYNGFFTKNRKPTDSNHISIRIFEEQMAYLFNNGYTCITLEEAETAFKTNKFEAKTFCITFDNGFYSQYKYAIPILNKYNWKATFFIPTLAIGEKNRKKLTNTFDFDLLPSDKMMDWEELELLLEQDHFVQSNGCYHHRDNLNSPEMIEVEVVESKHVLENTLGYEVGYFAFPFGAYNSLMVKNLKQHNYQMAFTNFHGMLNATTDIFRTPRIAFTGFDNLESFKTKLQIGLETNSKQQISKTASIFSQLFFLKNMLKGILKRIAG